MTPKEEARLKELTEKKKTEKLNSKEFKEFKELQIKQKSKGKSKPTEGFDPGNDPAWWKKIPELVHNSAFFKSNYVAGRNISTKVAYKVPGVLQVDLQTCYYPGSEATDAINVWARNTYLKMFQKYRPASGYSASDLGIAILAGFEAIKLIAMYERIYGIINRYSVMNVNMPITEAQAMGLSVLQLQTLQGRLSDFRYDLNFLIRKAQRLCIPKDISMLNDFISLLGYEYIDHANPRGQIILFNLTNYGIYSDTDMQSGGSITFDDNLMADLFDFTADNMCKALVNVLNALLGSDSIQRIYADLNVWFGSEAMLQVLPLPSEYVVVPVVSESILHKLHNAETAPTALASSGVADPVLLTSWAKTGLSSADEAFVLDGRYHVYQFMDSIVTVGVITDFIANTPVAHTVNGVAGKVLPGNNVIYGMNDVHIIDGYTPDPTEDFIVEGSLLKCGSYTDGNTRLFAIISSCVDWIVKQFTLFDTTGPVSITTSYSFNNSLVRQYAGTLALVDWAPLTYDVGVDGTGSVAVAVFGDLDAIVPVSITDLDRIQRTCFLSAITTDAPVKVS